jgi:hypothetical protein
VYKERSTNVAYGHNDMRVNRPEFGRRGHRHCNNFDVCFDSIVDDSHGTSISRRNETFYKYCAEPLVDRTLIYVNSDYDFINSYLFRRAGRLHASFIQKWVSVWAKVTVINVTNIRFASVETVKIIFCED